MPHPSASRIRIRPHHASRRTAARSISEIAADIEREWKNVNFGARPYLDAMKQLDSIGDMYYADDAKGIILYFLSNARSFTGERAKELKAELKALGSRSASRRTASRSISEIARDIRREWANVNFAAVPYLDAMMDLDSIDDMYGADSAKSIIAYFLSNASSFRGERAKELKEELKSLQKGASRRQAEQSGNAISDLDDVEVGDEDDRPMWPWELTEEERVGQGAAKGGTPTPGGEAGYPQPRRSSRRTAADEDVLECPMCGASTLSWIPQPWDPVEGPMGGPDVSICGACGYEHDWSVTLSSRRTAGAYDHHGEDAPWIEHAERDRYPGEREFDDNPYDAGGDPYDDGFEAGGNFEGDDIDAEIERLKREGEDPEYVDGFEEGYWAAVGPGFGEAREPMGDSYTTRRVPRPVMQRQAPPIPAQGRTADFRARVQAGVRRLPFAHEGGRHTAMPNPADLGVSEGDFFYASWGYDQTNVNFFEVLGLTAASVRLREVSQRVEGSGVVPVPGSYIGEPFIARINSGYRGEPSVSSKQIPQQYAWKWDGRPKYDTLALGYPGH
jgi:hypothetical protein